MSEKSDIELRRERLAQMKAEREAKKTGRPATTASPTRTEASPAAPTPATAPAPATTSAGAIAAGDATAPSSTVVAPPSASSNPSNWTRVTNVGAINILPPKIERHDRSEMTDTVYLSTEPISAATQGAAGGSAAQDAQIRELQAALAQAKEEAAKVEREAARRALYPVSSARTGATAAASSSNSLRAQDSFKDSLASTQFTEFAQRSVFILQRTLLTSVDLSFEGALGMAGADGTGRGNQVATKQSTFHTESVAGKVVGSVSCQRGGEYFAVAYSSPPEADGSSVGGLGTSHKGKVLVWSVRQSAVPVMEFSTNSDITCVTYSPFHPHLLIAGCSDGRVVIWDVRKGSRPVDASFPSYEGHNGSAIVEAAVVGKQNHNTLVTVASDGHVCLWDVESPTFPSVSFDVVSSISTKAILTSAASIPASGLVRFYVGGSDGIVYKGLRSGSSSSGHAEAKPIESHPSGTSSGRAGAASGSSSGSGAAGHVSTVTAMDCHPRLSKLVLSCSIDSTCRLSYDRSGESQQQAGSSSTQLDDPKKKKQDTAGGASSPAAQEGDIAESAPTLTAKEERAGSISIENFADFVYDAKWSPSHPGVFAAVDGAGALTFWNILVSLSNPISTAKLGGADGGSGSSVTALSALCWTPDGSHVVCGSSDGKTHLVAAAPELVHATSVEVNAFSDLVVRTFGATSAISQLSSSSAAGGAGDATAGGEENAVDST